MRRLILLKMLIEGEKQKIQEVINLKAKEQEKIRIKRREVINQLNYIRREVLNKQSLELSNILVYRDKLKVHQAKLLSQVEAIEATKQPVYQKLQALKNKEDIITSKIKALKRFYRTSREIISEIAIEDMTTREYG